MFIDQPRVAARPVQIVIVPKSTPSVLAVDAVDPDTAPQNVVDLP